MADVLNMKISSPNGILFRGKVAKASFPGAEGNFMVLPRHAPIIAALAAGVIKYTTDAGTQGDITVKGGFVEVNKDRITVAVETGTTGEPHQSNGHNE